MGLNLNTINQASTGAHLQYARSAPAYAATLALTTKGYHHTYVVGELTGAMTINLTVSQSEVGDRIEFLFDEDNNTGGRVVTFGTGMESSGTLTVAQDKLASAIFVFNGTAFVELSRTITA